MMIRDEIDSFLESQDEQNNTNITPVLSDDEETLDAQHIILGSGLAPISLKELQAKHSGDSAFRDLRKKTIASLTAILSSETGRYQKVTLTEEHQVRYFPFSHYQILTINDRSGLTNMSKCDICHMKISCADSRPFV